MGWAQRAGVAGWKRKQAREIAHQRTLDALRKRVARIQSLRDFEDMVLQADHPDEFRALVAPMLPSGLPCCVHGPFEAHQSRCPAQPAAPVLYGPHGEVLNA